MKKVGKKAYDTDSNLNRKKNVCALFKTSLPK